MSWVNGVIARARSMLLPRQAEQRMEEEFAFHLEMEMRKRVSAGETPEEARRNAMLTFGGVDAYRERMRDGWGQRWLGDFAQDVRYCVRSLARTPVFAVISVLTIALGVGASTGIFSIGNALVLRSLPLPESDRLVTINERRDGNVSTGLEGMRIPQARYEAYRSASGNTYKDVAAQQFRGFSVSVGGVATSEAGLLMSRNLLDVLALKPLLGRWPSDAGRAEVAISYDLWQRRFAGSRTAIGAQILIDGRPFTVAGIAPATFRGTTMPVIQDVWVPIDAFRFGSAPTSSDRWVGMIARLNDGVPMRRAAAATDAVAKRIPVEETVTKVYGARVDALRGITGDMRTGLGGFFGALLLTATLVLFIAASNIAGMLLARAVARQREIAVRMSIGAGRARLVRQLLTETIVLFIAGGLGGLLIAMWITRAFSSMSMPLPVPVQLDVGMDWRVLLFALGLAGATGILFGLAPALRGSRPDLVSALKGGSSSNDASRSVARNMFVTSQITMSVLLLVLAALLVRGLQRALTNDIGLEPAGVVVANIDLGAHGYDEARGRQFYTLLMDRIRALPDVRAAGLADRTIMGGNTDSEDVTSAGAGGVREANARLLTVDPRFFETVDLEVRTGRAFSDADGASGLPVVMVNNTLAETLWPGRNPIGQQVRKGKRNFTVIGTVSSLKYASVAEAPRSIMLFAYAQDYSSSMTLYVRSSQPSAVMLRAIREQVNAIDPGIALHSPLPLARVVDFTLFPLRFATLLLGSFGVLGLVLSALGVYGVLSFHVSQRVREFGIRFALGATNRQVLRLVLGQGAVRTTLGTVTGLLLGGGAGVVLASMVPGIQLMDPVTFVGVPVILGTVALLASYAPARRAARISPVTALKSD